MTKRILLAVSGSISAYKAANLTNQLTKLGYDVHVLMTKAATDFITPLTLQVLSKNAVHLDVMTEENPKSVNHIELAKKADLFVLAPASANTLAKLANGLADNMVTAIALALPAETPKLIAPTLKEVGYEEIEPRSSLLACGDIGCGALAELDTIIERIEKSL